MFRSLILCSLSLDGEITEHRIIESSKEVTGFCANCDNIQKLMYFCETCQQPLFSDCKMLTHQRILLVYEYQINTNIDLVMHVEYCAIIKLYLKDAFPNFVEAKYFGSTTPETIEERGRAISALLNFSLKNPVLAKTKILQQFLETVKEVVPNNTGGYVNSAIETIVVDKCVLKSEPTDLNPAVINNTNVDSIESLQNTE